MSIMQNCRDVKGEFSEKIIPKLDEQFVGKPVKGKLFLQTPFLFTGFIKEIRRASDENIYCVKLYESNIIISMR